MDMQTKRRYIHLLQSLIKFKYMTWDKNAIYTVEQANAKLYIPQLEELAMSVSRMAYNYGIYIGPGEYSTYDSDVDFMSHYNSNYVNFSNIPDGYSDKNTPFAGYMSELMSLLESGETLKAARIVGGLTGNFYIGTNKVFVYSIGGLTNERIPFLLRLVRKVILHPSAFRLYDPEDNVIYNGNMNTKYIWWCFEQGYTFTENGSSFDIKVQTFNPAKVIFSSEESPTATEIESGNSDKFAIIY